MSWNVQHVFTARLLLLCGREHRQPLRALTVDRKALGTGARLPQAPGQRCDISWAQCRLQSAHQSGVA